MEQKRIELHCHTNYSKMQATGRIHEYVDYAKKAGVGGIAFTDCDSVLAWSEIDRECRILKDELSPQRLKRPCVLSSTEQTDDFGGNGKTNFKLIHGIEMQVADKKNPEKSYPVTLLCKGGNEHLFRLLTEAEARPYTEHPILWLQELKKEQEVKGYVEDERTFGWGKGKAFLIGGGFVGSALYEAVRAKKGKEEIDKLVSWLDYIEVQPLKVEFRWINEKLIELGEKSGIPVVATSNCRCIQRKDEIQLKILAGQEELPDSGEMAGAYFRSTKEMLDEFSYLGEEKAKEIVVTNTLKIAKQPEINTMFSWNYGDHYLPNVKEANQRLKKYCEEKAGAVYGMPLSEQVDKRLKFELTVIERTNEASVLLGMMKIFETLDIKPYMIELKGRATNSLVAYLCGIGDIDPIQYGLLSNRSFGMDGEEKMGLEVSLPPEQREAIFGLLQKMEGVHMAVRAGIYGTLGEEKSRELMKNYEQKYGLEMSETEREQCLYELCGVMERRGAEHPSAILLIPEDRELYGYMPLCRAEKKEHGFVSGFEYFALSNKLYTLHLIPGWRIEMLQKLFRKTGVKPEDICEDDEKILAMFSSRKALGIAEDGTDYIKHGLLGTREGNSERFSQILTEYRPKNFRDVMQILGLVYHTVEYEDDTNAKGLLLEEQFCSREDISDYLEKKGIDESISYRISEYIGRGKMWNRLTLRKVFEMLARKHDIPDDVKNRLMQIKYLFPRGALASLAKVCWREAYFKLYYPEVFYQEYFKDSIYEELVDAWFDKDRDFEEWYRNSGFQWRKPVEEGEKQREMAAREMLQRKPVKVKNGDGK